MTRAPTLARLVGREGYIAREFEHPVRQYLLPFFEAMTTSTTGSTTLTTDPQTSTTSEMTATIGATTTPVEVVCHVGSVPINASMPYHTYTPTPPVYTSQGYGGHYYAAPPPGYVWYPNPATFPTTPTPFSGWQPYHTPTAASVYTRPQPTLPPPPLFNVPESPKQCIRT